MPISSIISDIQSSEEKDDYYLHGGRHVGNKKVEVTSVGKDPPSSGLQALITQRLEEHNKKIKFSRDKWQHIILADR